MRLYLALLALFVLAATAMAADLPWPRWRGPNDSGSVADGKYPANLLDEKKLNWKVKLPGIGCSTPAVLSDRIFVTCPVDGHNGVIALDWQGKEQWRTKLGEERRGKHRNGSAANSSPVTDGNFIFAYFKSGELATLDLSGKLLWTTNLQTRFAKDTLYWDVGTSPIVTEKAVIVATMHSGESYLAAFEKASGELLWKVSRNYQTPVEGDHSYATPIVVKRDGREILLVWGAEHLTAHSTDDGKTLWSCGGFNPDRKGNWVQVASAVVDGDMAVVPYGRGARIAGIKLDGTGDVTATHRVWTHDDLGSFVPSPVAYQGNVYVVRDEGEVVCLNIKTGATVWIDRLPKNRNKYYASPMIAGGRMYAPREDGVVFVADVQDGFKLVSENDMQERIIASPVAVSGKLLIRGEEHLYCFSE
ncbi:Outer membrane protein assembly factor BamB precursor [Anatilimnocola aggregata]|uniref:Outer membrane protein assembly factor BamB n=1 Tax=Anatilimnocola aggregata TaxID=2528021 RepID=A0A517YCL4_9BACT|nr:PQQ-binding-like beta-propeller repeat protein [Anatilimnocola aggregata]QDU27970.1 Outer membrane protein assembly factor BamB precursor [Anatilimnocola aggregata]